MTPKLPAPKKPIESAPSSSSAVLAEYRYSGISRIPPNVAIVAPGGISVMLNEQTTSVNGNQGSMTVNAIHVTGPGIDIVVAGAESDITC